jgi:hypothetical protein
VLILLLEEEEPVLLYTKGLLYKIIFYGVLFFRYKPPKVMILELPEKFMFDIENFVSPFVLSANLLGI